MDEYEFERFIADLWEMQGWDTTVSQASNDRGVDVTAEKSNPVPQKHLIQVKRYATGNTVGVRDVREYSSLLNRDGVDSVIVVTTSSFTKSAETEAKNLDVKLIGGSELCNLIFEVGASGLIREFTNFGKSGSISSTSEGIQVGVESPFQDQPSTYEEIYNKDGQCSNCEWWGTIWVMELANSNDRYKCENCGNTWTETDIDSNPVIGAFGIGGIGILIHFYIHAALGTFVVILSVLAFVGACLEA